MKKSHIIIILVLLLLLLALNQLPRSGDGLTFGALPWYGWVATVLLLVVLGLISMERAADRASNLLKAPPPQRLEEQQQRAEKAKQRRMLHDPNGPDYPHPFIIEDNCIACNACIEACPHDVLMMIEKKNQSGHVAHVKRGDLCMEDTACEAVCPTSPKACIVINSTKEIKPVPAPARNQYFMSSVEGCYIIGDVSGVPLIKNAVKEGEDVIEHIARSLESAPPEPKAKLAVAVVGIGPGGLSAILAAKKRSLKFIGIEQDKVLATIEGYPKNKHIEFKPEHLETDSALPLESGGAQRESILESWTRTLADTGIEINRSIDGAETTAIDVIRESERCTGLKRAEDGDYFIISTASAPGDKENQYRARRVILAIGLRGAPMMLGGPGGKMITGEKLTVARGESQGPRVLYKLSDPANFRRCKVIVVGGGNSSIEAAVDLVARRSDDRLDFLSDIEINEVMLLLRSDFTKDVKFRNKQQIYECSDRGKVNLRFRTVIKEIQAEHVIIEDTRTKKRERVRNDFVFALIGGERPDKFLKDNNIHIP